jgi:hypothetical protein
VLSYLNAGGCRDSIRFQLSAVPAGSIDVSYNQLTCQGFTNGLAVLSLTPSSGSAGGFNGYTITSTGGTAAYNSTLYPTASLNYTANNLAGAGTYSVMAFDGSCFTSSTFTVNTFMTANLFTLAAAGSTALWSFN